MRPKPKMNPLDKRIKPNPKYNKVVVSSVVDSFECQLDEIPSLYQVEPTINTGNNLRKELERLEEVVIINDLVKIVLNQC